MRYICLFADAPDSDLEQLINWLIDQASLKARRSFQGFNDVCQVEFVISEALFNHAAKRNWHE